MASLPCKHVLIVAEGYSLEDAGLWEAMRLFEMHSDVALVGGRVLDQTDIVVDCCATGEIVDGGVSPWIGKLRTDPGAYAMALKPQTVATVPQKFFFCRTEVLREALASMEIEGQGLEELSSQLSALVRSRGLRIAYSPLVEAVERSSARETVSMPYFRRKNPCGFIVRRSGCRARETWIKNPSRRR